MLNDQHDAGTTVPVLIETDQSRLHGPRIQAMIAAGLPVWLRGPLGCGKTALAHLAARAMGYSIRSMTDMAVSAGGQSITCLTHHDLSVSLPSGMAEAALWRPGTIVTGPADTGSDVLSDRLVVIDVQFPDRGSEVRIVATLTGLDSQSATGLVDLVRDLRQSDLCRPMPSLRSALMVARLAVQMGVAVNSNDERFVALCHDVLLPKVSGSDTSEDWARFSQALTRLIDHYCPPQERVPALTVVG